MRFDLDNLPADGMPLDRLLHPRGKAPLADRADLQAETAQKATDAEFDVAQLAL